MPERPHVPQRRKQAEPTGRTDADLSPNSADQSILPAAQRFLAARVPVVRATGGGDAVEVLVQTSAMRTVGVEEELLLVDVHTGKPRSVASRSSPPLAGTTRPEPDEGGVEAELQRYMVETQSSAASELADIEAELRQWRRVVADAARDAGAGVAALATAPFAGTGLISSAPRYRRMAERFGRPRKRC